MMNIITIAQKAGTSKSTVSRVINGSGPVKESTRKKVLETMEALGYRPNIFAQGMKTNQSRTIAVLIPEYTNPFFPALLAAIELVLRPQDYVTMVCSGGTDEHSELASIRFALSRRVDGIIFHSYDRHNKTVKLLLETNKQIPVVLMDPMMKNPKISSVFVDGFKGTVEALQHLVRVGRRRIAYIKGTHDVVSDRFQGYRQALDNAGLKMPETYVYEGDFTMESGVRAAQYFLGLDQIPDAIVSGTDNMAFGVINGLLKAGIRIPEQICVVGFDNLEMSSMFVPSLSSIAVPIPEIGQKAAQILLHQIAHPNTSPSHIVLDCKLMLRDSMP